MLSTTTDNSQLSIATATNTITNLNNLGVTIGTSCASLDSELNSVYAYLVGQVNGKVDQGPFDTLLSVYSAFQTAQEIWNGVQVAWNFTQSNNNYTQQTEIDTLQGQIESANTRIDTHEEQMGISFPQTNAHFGVLEEFKTVCLSTTFTNFDNKVVSLGASVSNVNNYSALIGTTVIDNANRIDNLIGVSVYNIDSWKGVVIGTTIPAIAVSINNLNFGTSYSGLVTMGVSHRADIAAGISFRGDVGVSYTGLITTGISHINLITSLGISVAACDTSIGIIGTTVTNQSVSLGVSYGGIITTGISHLNFITSIGTSSGALETNKADKLLVSVSSGTLNNQIIAVGTSSNLETNKADKLLVSTSASNYLQRNETVIPATFSQH